MSQNAPHPGSQRIAVISAIGVAVAVLVLVVVSWLTSLITNAIYGGSIDSAAAISSDLGWSAVSAALEGAIVGLVVGKVIPLDAGARISRIGVAAGLSAVIVAIVDAFISIGRSVSFGLLPDRSLFSGSFPDLNGLSDSARAVASAVVGVPFAALSAFALIALVVLVVTRFRGEVRRP